MNEKKQLRQMLMQKRANISDKAERDALISNKLLNSLSILNADTVLIYASFGSEINTFHIIEILLQLNKKVALPICMENGQMIFRLINTLVELKPRKYNIPEPDINNTSPIISNKTICIVPGLAFTENGGRLGYGGGYYDRFIAKYPDLFTIGLSYESLVINEIPLLPHDLHVKTIITEERMVLCCAE